MLLGAAGHVGELVELCAGRGLEGSLVDAENDATGLDQGVVDVPEDERGRRRPVAAAVPHAASVPANQQQ